MRKINAKLFLVLLVGAILCTGAVFGIHHFQYGRIADSLLWQARRAEEQGQVKRQARYLQRYLEFNGNDLDEKARLAKKNGADAVILYNDEDFVARVKEITGGKLCDVVYDGIGKDTFPASLDCIRPLGMFVSFGSASGQIDAFNINILQTKGSLFATRPTLNNYVAKREDLVATANDLFSAVSSGAVKIPINQKYPLKDAQQAHRDLEGRDTTGSSILIP